MKTKITKITKKTKESVSTKEIIYSSIKLMGRIYIAQGQTIQEAIMNLKPDIVKGFGLLILQKGEVKKIKVLMPKMIVGLFGKTSRLMKEIALKQVLNLFNKEIFEK